MSDEKVIVEEVSIQNIIENMDCYGNERETEVSSTLDSSKSSSLDESYQSNDYNRNRWNVNWMDVKSSKFTQVLHIN